MRTHKLLKGNVLIIEKLKIDTFRMEIELSSAVLYAIDSIDTIDVIETYSDWFQTIDRLTLAHYLSKFIQEFPTIL